MLVDVVRLGLHTLYYKVQTEWFTLVGVRAFLYSPHPNCSLR